MTKPYILSVDDEPQVLNAVNRDLRRHYQRDYRILKAGSGQEALGTLQQLKELPVSKPSGIFFTARAHKTGL